jgi:hypothetical protein
MTEDHSQRFPDSRPEPPSFLAFDDRARAALALRMAGYSEPQVLKLLARGHGFDEGRDAARRAA